MTYTISGLRGSNANESTTPASGGSAASGDDSAFAVEPCEPSASGPRRTRTAAAVPAEADKRDNSGCAPEQRSSAAPSPPPPRPPARLLDQRLQISDPLLEIAILLDLRPAEA